MRSTQELREEIFRRMAERNWPLMGLKSMEMSLEEIFIELTRERVEAAPAKRSVRRRTAKKGQKEDTIV